MKYLQENIKYPQMAHIYYSVIIPVFQSEDLLSRLFEKIKNTFEKAQKSFEIIFIDDGSKDDSWKVLSHLKSNNPDLVTAIRLNKNYGQHSAIMCGFNFVRGDFIITMDDDLQHPPEEILKLIHAGEESQADMVYGVYRKKQHSVVRNIGSYSVRKYSGFFHKNSSKGSSFRLIKRSIIDKILDHNLHFIYIDEVLQWYTDKITLVEVEHHKRKGSKSGYSVRKLFRMASDLVFFYTTMPLKMMVYGGFIVSFFTFLLGLHFIIKKIFQDIPLGYTSMIVTILFSTSLIIFSLGVIGGYISRIYQIQKKKPPYHIDKVL